MQNTTIRNVAFIENLYSENSLISGPIFKFDDNTLEQMSLNIYNSDFFSSAISGYHNIEGSFINNSSVFGSTPVYRAEGIISRSSLQPFSVLENARVSGNQYIGGLVKGGYAGGITTFDRRSGVNPGAIIGFGGRASCTYIVEGGELNTTLCNRRWVFGEKECYVGDQVCIDAQNANSNGSNGLN